MHKALRNKRLLTALLTTTVFSFGSAHATDLSIGVKGLKLGMQKGAVLAEMEAMFNEVGGIFAPDCSKTEYGDSCIAIGNGNKLTYGRSEIALVRFNFGNTGLDQLILTLTMAGCGSSNTNALHPKEQFKTLTRLLTEQFGPPKASSESRKVWLDDSAMLLVDLSPPEKGMNVYPNCDSTKVLYIDKRKAAARIQPAGSKSRDL